MQNMKQILSMLFLLFFSISFAQNTGSVSGKISDAESGSGLNGVQVKIKNSFQSTQTNVLGEFTLNNAPVGNQILVISLPDYETQEIPVVIVSGKDLELDDIRIYPDLGSVDAQGVITLSSGELSDDEMGTGNDNIAGILQSSKDTYQRVVAYNFGQVWFKSRGYDSSYGEVMFNGIPMNKVDNGRPQWSDWGGLNDALRNQEFTDGLAPSEQRFGGVLGSTNFITRASKARKGGRLSYAATNSNYVGRTMLSYNTGVLKNDWAFSVLASKRYAQEGYVEGTTYNAWGFYMSAEKKLNDHHSLNFTGFFTPNRRGKNSPNTQEVYDLGGTKYNSYWGWQGPYKRNARMKEIQEPTFMMSHYWDINDGMKLNTNIMYQTGTISNSRLDYRGVNPDPTYYQNLPSYYLQHPDDKDYQTANEQTQFFLNKTKESQILWEDLYYANSLANLHNEPAYYLQYNDVNKSDLFAINSVLFKEINEHITLNASAMYKGVKSNYYAEVMDLLGANYFIDENKYAKPDEADNDVNNPNRNVSVGDKFKYDYVIDSKIMDAFAQAGFSYNKVDFYVALNGGMTTYQRDGKYLNGEYQKSSFGKGKQVNFTTYGAKAGLTYKIDGHNYLVFNGGYMSKAPGLRNTYANSRVSNNVVPNLTTEKITSGDFSYLYRTGEIKARLTGYYTTFKDLSEVSFYYVQGLTGVTHTDDFLTAALYGVNKKNMGLEFGLEAKLTPTVKLLGAAAIGQFTYDNNPQLQVAASENDKTTYTSYLKNYKQSGTPQQGYSIGFEYRDPKYWWVSANANLLRNNYIGLSSLRRSDNFYRDYDGSPLVDVTQDEIDKLLAQEKLNDIFLVNIVGGKSWKIQKYYVGFFASINNLLNEVYKTGGFEQSRKGNFANLKEDMELEHPLFGNKYWYGRGTSYYLNFYLRF